MNWQPRYHSHVFKTSGSIIQTLRVTTSDNVIMTSLDVLKPQAV